MRRTTVLILTPLGLGGMGGIDRLMDEIRRRTAAVPDLELIFIATRGAGRLIFSPLYCSWAALLLIWYRLARGHCVVHVNLASKGSTLRKLVLTWLAKRLGHNTIIHLHGALFHEYYRAVGGFQRRQIDRMFHEASQTVVLGTVWRDFVHDAFGLDARHVLVLPNATAAQAAERAREDSPPRILFLGRLGTRKGVPVLIEALASLAQTDLAWQADIAGDGDVATYRTQAQAAGLGARVTFPGWLDATQAHERLARAAVLVLPSEAEGLPMSVIEAYAWGIPVVATPVGSIPDILHDGVQGLVVPVGDSEKLAFALGRLVGDASLRRQCGRHALAYHRANLEFTPFLERLAACWRQAASKI